MTESQTCQSCTMPIESGSLCEHCGDHNGELRPFDELFPRMVQWTMHNDATLSREVAEQQTAQFMSTMPAWQEREEVRQRLAKS